MRPPKALAWPHSDRLHGRGTTKRLHHPVVGELELECELLDIADRGQRLVIYTAAPGSRSAEALRLLDVVGTQWA